MSRIEAGARAKVSVPRVSNKSEAFSQFQTS